MEMTFARLHFAAMGILYNTHVSVGEQLT